MLLMLILLLSSAVSADNSSFIFNGGFKSGDLHLDGGAHILQNGLLGLVDQNYFNGVSEAFFPTPFVFKNSSSNTSSALNFSTHFVLQMHDRLASFTFVLAPTTVLQENGGDSSNHTISVLFDSVYDVWVQDQKYSFYLDNQPNQPINVWVTYAFEAIQIELAAFNMKRELAGKIHHQVDISNIINQNMYVGFVAFTFRYPIYILGWSFAINVEPAELINSRLPKVPSSGGETNQVPPLAPSSGGETNQVPALAPRSGGETNNHVTPLVHRVHVKPIEFFKYGLPTIVIVSCLILVAINVSRKIKYSEVIEDWEVEYISHRFKYKDLYNATQGFKNTHIVGKGGFGKVYRGLLQGSNIEVAVKKISLDSKQGTKEFVAEIITIGRLRHRNLTPLLGYCRRKKEFLLVYEYMPHGSLENHIHGEFNAKLDWSQRFHIIKGIAHGLLFLHEEWEQVVIHRDIKPSNVLLDRGWNARLGDFGLARLHDRGSDPSTTKIVGTLGYIAPEHTQTGKATTRSDVYGFGTLILEVATGRRPIGCNDRLVEWVYSLWTERKIQDAIDPNLIGNVSKEEVEFVIKLGLVCSNYRPHIRPSIKDIVGYLENPSTLPQHLLSNAEDFLYYKSVDENTTSMLPSSSSFQPSGSFFITNSVTVSGR